MDIAIKFCGLTRPQDIDAAIAADARYVGFVFFPKSPRHVTLDQARALALSVPPGVAKVALTVDADDAALRALLAEVPVDILQLHGHESPARVAEVRARFGLPVMKALGIADADDLAQIDAYQGVADQLLIDAKPPKGADLPGQRAFIRLAPFGWAQILDPALDAGGWSDTRQCGRGGAPDRRATGRCLLGGRGRAGGQGCRADGGFRDRFESSLNEFSRGGPCPAPIAALPLLPTKGRRPCLTTFSTAS